MKPRHPLIWVLGFTAFAMNPALACSSSPEDEFDYGEAEMIAAVQGTWQVTVTPPDARISTVTFRVERGTAPNGALAAPPGLTPQCGTRTFTRPAAACVSSSQLALAASIVNADPPLDISEGKGWFTVRSLKYTGGQMTLTFGTSLVVRGNIDVTNEMRDSEVTWQGFRTTAVVTRTTR
jgi:hypothetical protein